VQTLIFLVGELSQNINNLFILEPKSVSD